MLHNASFLGFGAPIFEIRNIVKHSDLMISSAPLGRAMVAAMGTAAVVLLRGHGNVVVGPTMPITVFRAYYTEVNARQQLNAMALNPDDVVYMDAGECETTDKIMQSGREASVGPVESENHAWTLGRPLWRSCPAGSVLSTTAGKCSRCPTPHTFGLGGGLDAWWFWPRRHH